MPVVIVQLLYDVNINLMIKLDKTDECKAILIVKNIMEQPCMRTSLHLNYLYKVV